MTQETSPERLEQYTRALVFEGPGKAHLYISPILPEEVSLFKTIDLLWENMQIVAPETEFRNILHARLSDEAKRAQAMQRLGLEKESHRSHTPWIASAAVVGAAATLAGAFAYWRWAASRQAV